MDARDESTASGEPKRIVSHVQLHLHPLTDKATCDVALENLQISLSTSKFTTVTRIVTIYACTTNIVIVHIFTLKVLHFNFSIELHLELKNISRYDFFF